MFKVTNNNDFDFTATFDGKAFNFPKGETRLCPDDAVIHIFGLGSKDKSAVVSRHGWAKPTEAVDVGLQKLRSFKFEEVRPQFDHRLATESYGPAPVVSGTVGDEGTDGPTLPTAKPTNVLGAAAALANQARRNALAPA